ILFYNFHLTYLLFFFSLFFFTTSATTHFSTLSLHDALPISHAAPLPLFRSRAVSVQPSVSRPCPPRADNGLQSDRRCSSPSSKRSEEHTSELQSLAYLVCRLLLEKKKKKNNKLKPSTP